MDPLSMAVAATLIAIVIIVSFCFYQKVGQPMETADADQYVKMLYGDDNKKNKKANKKNKQPADDKKKATKVEEEVKAAVVPAQKKAREIVKRTPTPEVIPQDPRDESSDRGSTDDAAPAKPVEKKRADSHLRNETEKLIANLHEFAISEKVLSTVVEKIRQLDHYQQMSKTHRNQIESLEKAGRQANEKITSLEKKVADDQRRMKEMHQTIEGEKNKSKRLDQEIVEKSSLLNATIHSLVDQKNLLESDAATLRDQIAQLAKSVNDERARAEQFRHKNAALETERVKLTQELKQYESNARKQPEKIQQQHVQPVAAAAAPAVGNPADQQTIKRLQHQLDEESQHHKTTRNELHKLQKANEQSSSQHHNLLQRFTELETELKAARQHIEQTAAGGDKEAVIHELQTEVEKLGLKRNDMEQQMQTLTHERDRLHKAHKQAEGTIQSLKQKLADQANADQAQLNEARATIQSLESTINQLNATAKFEGSDTANDAEKQQLLLTIETLKRSVSDTEKERDAAKAQLDSAEAAKNAASAHSSNAEQTIANLKQEVTALNRKIAELNEQLNQQNATLNGKIDELSRERMQLQQRCDEAAAKASSANAAAGDSDNINGLTKQLAELQAKNQELRAKNYAVLEAVAQAEKVGAQLAHEKAKFEQQTREQAKIIDDLKKKAASDDDVVTQKEVKFATAVQNGHDSADLVALRDENNMLKDMIEKLKSASSSTSKKASSSISDDVEQQLRSENDSFRQALRALGDQLSAIETSERLEIEKYETRCAWLAMQLQEAQSAAAAASPAIDPKVNERLIVLERELESEKAEYGSVKEQLAVLQKALETERATGASLSQEAVKLRGMLKVGQDALKQEQSITANLREQLKHFQDNEHVNGL